MKPALPWIAQNAIEAIGSTSKRTRKILSTAVRTCFEQLETRQLLSGASPVAATGGAYTVNEGASVAISGTGSSDSDGTIVSYKWDLNYNAGLGFRTSITGAAFTYHAADGNVARTIALRVTDNDGNITTATTTLTINNVAPTLTLSGNNSAAEGATYTLNWTRSDPGQDTISSYVVDWGDGTSNTTVAGTVSSTTHVFTDPASNTITLTATDEDGSFTQTKAVTVTTVNPVVTLTGGSNVGEGASYDITFTSVDTGGDALDGWVIDWGDGDIAFYDPALSTSSHTYADDGSYTVTVTAQASDGDTGSDTIALTVDNIAPEGTITGVPGTSVAEGTAVTVGSTESDPGDDTTSYAWSVLKSGSTYTLPGGTTTNASGFTFTPRDNGSYVIRLVESDEDGGSTTIDSDAFTVANVAPTVAISGEPVGAIDEGDAINLTATPSDAGEDDTFSYAWTATLDGNAYPLTGATTNASTLNFTTLDDGTYVFSVTVTDDDGATGTDSSSSITVNNVDPTGTISGEPVGSIEEGTAVNLTVAGQDVGDDDALSYAWTVTKGGNPFTLPGNAVTDEASFSFTPTDEGTYVATVAITDDDGGTVSVDSASITVTNADPTGTISGEPSGPTDEGTAISLTVDPSDAGSTDTFTYSWAVTKDGNTFNLPGGTDTTSAAFTFTPTDNGDYIATVTLTDNDGGDVDISTSTITVGNADPGVVITGVPNTAVEGDSITLGTTVTDAGTDDTHTYVWSVYKGNSLFTLPGGTDTTSASFTFIPTDNGDYSARVVVTDDDGGTMTVDSDFIGVTNASPTVAISGEPVGAIDEGDAINLTATPADAGDDDTFTYAWTATLNGDSYPLTGVTTDASTLNFTTLDNGTYVFTVTVTDDDEATGSDSSSSITVNNVDPAGSISGEPVGSIAEGTAVNLTVAATDAGDDDALSYSWSVTKNGSNFILPSETVTDETGFSFTPTDNGTYVATVVVTDDDGGDVSINSSSITVTNAAPTATISGEPSSAIEEGDSVSLAVSPADAGSADTFTYSWSVTKDGNAYNLPGGTDTTSASFSFAPNDEGTFVATCEVTDDDGDSVTATSDNITVTNVAPGVTITGTPSSAVEGDTISLGSTVADAGSTDTVATYAWSVTKDSDPFSLPGGLDTASSTFDFVPTDNGTYVVTLAVTDNDGSTTTVSTDDITVTNANPTAVVSGEPVGSIAEGTAVNLTVTPSDAGSADTFTYAWSVTKNGDAYELPGGTTTDDDQFSFTPGDNGTFVATVVVTDDDGGTVSVSSTSIAVTNENPTATISGEPVGSIAEGTAVTLTAAGADAGDDDSLSYSWSVTKNGNAFTLPDGAVTDEAEFTFTPTDNGTFVATVVVTDDDGGDVSVDSADITVTNVAPTGTITSNVGDSTFEGDELTFSAHTEDAGVNDEFTYSWSVTKDSNVYNLPGGTTVDESTFSFIPTDNGDYVATVTITDDDGGDVDVSSDTISVLNATPSPTITGAPSTAVEGDTISLGSTVTDSGSADTVATYAWSVTKNGNAFTLPGGTDTASRTFEFVPTDNGSFVVTLQVTDDDGGSDSVTQTITVTNAAPTASISGEPVGSIDEGDSVNLTVTPTDAGAGDTFTYAWSVTKNGNAYTLPGETDTESSSFSFAPTDNGTYVATVVVTDDDGDDVSVSTDDITVVNANPTGEVTGEPIGTIDEGDSVTVTAVPSDAGSDDTFTYSWSVSRNGDSFALPDGSNTTASTLTFTTTDNGDYTATVVITDDDGGSVSVDSADITAGNVAPTGSIEGAPETGEEGTAITVTASADDVGSEDTFTYSWSVTKNGNAFALPGGTTTNDAALTFTPTDNGTYVATVAITDDDAGSVNVSTSNITITNVAPSVTVNGAPVNAINEGATVSLTTTVSDVASADTVFTYAWSVTKDGSAYTLPGGTTTNASSFSFAPNDNGVFVVTAVVTDDDGGATTKTKSITVNNVNPTVTVAGLPGSSITEGTAINLTSTATDSGSADTLSYEWSVRKNGSAYSLTGVTTDSSTFSFTPNDNGSYVVTLTVTDDDGGAGLVNTAAVTVTNVAPTATLTGTPGSSISEGTAVNLTVTPSDVGTADTFTYAWTVTRDGSSYSLSGVTTNAATLAFTPNDEGTYIATCVINDDDGGSVTKTSSSITATNAAPTASITGVPEDNTTTEGTLISLSSTASDPGSADTLSYAWSVTKNGDSYSTGNTANFSFTPNDNGTYVVSLTVSDNDGASVVATPQTIAVTNVAPSVQITGLPESVNEGDEITLGTTITDASTADTTAGFVVDWTITKDGEAFLSGTGETYSFTATDDGDYGISVSVSDQDESAGIDTASITAENVDPEVTITGTPESGAEGTQITLGSSVTDAGSVDQEAGFTYTWSVNKDGNVYDLPIDTDVTSSTLQFTPTDDGSYTISLTVTDKDGGSTSASTTVEVANVVPGSVVITGAPNSSVEGTAISVSGTATDAGDDDSLTYAWTVTKNGSNYANGNEQDFTFTPTDNGAYVIRLVVTDDDGGAASPVTKNVTVTNAIPTGSISATSTGVRGRETTFVASVSDVGTADTEAVSINWGDGSAPDLRASGSTASFNLTHVYASTGTFPLTMTLVDDDGGTRNISSSVTIKAFAIQQDPMDSSRTALIVGGTSGDDNIKFALNTNGRVKLTINGELLGTFAPTGHIIAYGDAGANSIIVDTAVVTPAVLYGGSGKDTLIGGGADDVLVGRKGNDVLVGNAGRDILIGGVGADSITGGGGEDILMGGSTAGAESFSTLKAITDEWSRTDSIFLNRVKHLKGTLSGGLNGNNKLTESTVFEDAQADSMAGGTGKDWFFTNILPGSGEIVSDFSTVDDVITNVAIGISSKPKA